MKDYERFVERGTDYAFEHGTLSVYETNCPCKDVYFNFDSYMLTLMLSGHKTIITSNLNVEFYPGILFIPEKDIGQSISISNASFTNPTKCLVLNISPWFLEKFYFEYQKDFKTGTKNEAIPEKENSHFFSNDTKTIDDFKRLYEHVKSSKTKSDEIISRLILKELLVRLFHTEAIDLLLTNIGDRVNDKVVERTVSYIKQNFKNKITIDELADLSGFGKTKFFDKFKNTLGITPINYIMNERIKHSKKLMSTPENMKSIAYQSGFNTYEHFYKSFKKIVGESPLNYKKKNSLMENASF